MLDASTRIDVLNLLGDLKERGLGILFITHDLSLGNYISDRTMIMRRGALVELGADRSRLRQPAPPVHEAPARSPSRSSTRRWSDDAAGGGGGHGRGRRPSGSSRWRTDTSSPCRSSRRPRRDEDERRRRARRTLPARVLLGRRGVRVPDRRRVARGRPRRVDLGPLLRDAREVRNGDERRRRVRLLPPLSATTSRSCASSASGPSASRSRGRASCPDGRGAVNAAGLDFYDRLVDALLAAGIAPCVDALPLGPAAAARGRGRLAERATADAFADYTEAVARPPRRPRPAWITHNEPWCQRWLGYGLGAHAPGRRASAPRSPPRTTCSSRTASRSRSLRREFAARRGRDHARPVPDARRAGDAAEDAAAARALRRLPQPLVPRSGPPRRVPGRHARALRRPTCRRIADGDLATIAAPTDFLGVNHYTRTVVRADSAGGAASEVRVDGAGHTDMGWEVYPAGLREILLRVAAEYAPPAIWVTENGADLHRRPRPRRQGVATPSGDATSSRYLRAVGDAIAAGVPVRGTCVWSLLDNFEWALGYRAPVRARLRRLPDARARPQGELRVVPRPDRRARGAAQRAAEAAGGVTSTCR